MEYQPGFCWSKITEKMQKPTLKVSNLAEVLLWLAQMEKQKKQSKKKNNWKVRDNNCYQLKM
jgi:hypothetical protein